VRNGYFLFDGPREISALGFFISNNLQMTKKSRYICQVKQLIKIMKTYYFTFKGTDFTVNADGLTGAWQLANVHIGYKEYDQVDGLLIRGFLTHNFIGPLLPSQKLRLDFAY